MDTLGLTQPDSAQVASTGLTDSLASNSAFSRGSNSSCESPLMCVVYLLTEKRSAADDPRSSLLISSFHKIRDGKQLS